jgi:CSLREA domain-containing protein
VLRRFARLALAVLLLGLLPVALQPLPDAPDWLPSAPVAHAAGTTIQVTDLSDAVGGCTLRQAIADVNSQTGSAACNNVANADTITFSAGGTISLTAQLDITGSVAIQGPATGITLDGQSAVRLLQIGGGTQVSIDGLSFANGNTATSGGGILNKGTLTVTNATFTGNNASQGGGGLSNQSGVLTVINSTFTGNAATQSGGGIDSSGGAVAITNTTFFSDTSNAGGGIFNSSPATITNATFAGNSAVAGTGVRTANGMTTIRNTIVANGSGGSTCASTFGNIIDGGYNISADSSCNFTATTSLVNTAALLDPAGPRDNGGATMTILPLSTSPALNAIPNGVNGCGGAISTDQRGVARPQQGACDIGAVELTSPLVVNSLADTALPTAAGVCTLRQAIAAANNLSAGGCNTFANTITFSVTGTIPLSSTLGTLSITSTATIQGPAGGIVLDGQSAVRILQVGGGTQVSIDRVSFAHGTIGGSGGGILNSGTLTVTNATFASNYGDSGGGIANSGTLNVSSTTFSGNSSGSLAGGLVNNANVTLSYVTFISNTGNLGGGVRNFGTITVTNATFSGNSAADGGGLSNGGGTVNVTNATFSGNSSPSGGGAIFSNSGPLTFTNVTFSGNNSSSDGAAILSVSPVTLRGTIVANSTGGGSNCVIFGGDGGYNLSDDASCHLTASTSLSNTAALLDPAGLKNNGGPTMTILPLATSPAVNKIPNGVNGCGTTVATDQRGVVRPQNGTCDIGASERQALTLSASAGNGQSTQVGAPFPSALQISLTDLETTLPVTTTIVTYTVPGSGASAMLSAPTATLTGGVASVTATANALLGSYVVTATTALAGVPAVTFGLTNTLAAPAIAVTSSPNPSVVGQAVTVTAVLSGGGALPVPAGAVTFTGASGVLAGDVALSGGTAVYTSATVPVGSGVITVTYSGDATFLTASGNVTQVVNKAGTTTGLAASPNPANAGQTVTLTGTVSVQSPGAGTPSGTLQFFTGGTPLGAPQPLATGRAVVTANSLPVGTTVITVAYSGDVSFLASTGTLPGGLTVNPLAGALAISLSDGATTTVPGTVVTYTLNVTNTAGIAATNAPLALTAPGLTGVTWTCTAPGGSSCPATGTGAPNTPVTLAASGGTAQLTIRGTIDPSATGTLTATAVLTAPAGFAAETVTAQDVDALTPQSALSVTITGSNPSPNPGDAVVYTITVSNGGPSTADAQAKTTFVPGLTGVTSQCAASAGSSCTGTAQTSLVALAVGGTTALTQTVQLLPGGVATIVVQGTVLDDRYLTPNATVTVTNLGGTSPPGQPGSPLAGFGTYRLFTAVAVPLNAPLGY